MLVPRVLLALAIGLQGLAGGPPAAAASADAQGAGWAELAAGAPLVVERTADLGFAAVAELAVSGDGAWLATSHVDHYVTWREPRTGRNDGGITLWRAAELEPEHELAGHRFGEGSLDFTPDGRLISGGSDRTIRLWDPATGHELQRIGDEKRFITSVAVSPAGRYLLAGGSDSLGNWLTRGLSVLWDLVARRHKPGYLQLWDLDSGARVRGYAGNEDDVTDVAVTPDGKLVVAAGIHEDRVRAWELATGTLIAELELGGARKLAVLQDSRGVVAAGRERTVVLDLASGEVVDGWPVGASELGILGGGRLVVAALPERLVLRDLERRETLVDPAFPAGEDRTTALAVAPDGESFVVGTRAGRLARLRLAGAPAAADR